MSAFACVGKHGLLLMIVGCLMLSAAASALAKPGKGRAEVGPLGPRGKVHVPIGIADTVDTLKTFVEAEGCFSPGVGSYGVYFWLFDPRTGKLTAPTMPDVKTAHGLPPEGYLIPWTTWAAGTTDVRIEVCHVLVETPGGAGHVVGARVHLTNAGKADRPVQLYAALRPLGPAGGPIR